MILCTMLLLSNQAKMQGILFGKPVWFDHVTIKKFSNPARASSNGKVDKADVYSLTFQVGDDLIYDQGLNIYLNVNLGTKFDRLRVDQPSVKFGTPEYSKAIHGQTTGVSCGRGAMAIFISGEGKSKSSSEQIKFKFASKSIGNGRYKASIYAYNSEHKTGVQGNFTFKLEKF